MRFGAEFLNAHCNGSSDTQTYDRRRYAKMADEALVTVLRPVVASTEDEDLSRTCPTDFSGPSNIANVQKKLASPTGRHPLRVGQPSRPVRSLPRGAGSGPLSGPGPTRTPSSSPRRIHGYS